MLKFAICCVAVWLVGVALLTASTAWTEYRLRPIWAAMLAPGYSFLVCQMALTGMLSICAFAVARELTDAQPIRAVATMGGLILGWRTCGLLTQPFQNLGRKLIGAEPIPYRWDAGSHPTVGRPLRLQ